ncbi:hypothetical protein [Chryseosolibacter indicus]|uniref:DUF4249 family protein n=1 Tax=Chryseosolibacter indicus TaxID=2782351 RepID=A0ABS5VPW6_9BACT|nr:hypothetical protein [Chryseosolibacter indicus]MBT1703495.1 hypothetical protein [Chryseosolibacter indicus]
MKLVKSLILLSFFSILFGSCFDPPEYPVIPSIEYECIGFYTGQDTDSLIIYLNFKDGDGNLGLAETAEGVEAPFNEAFYFQEGANGQLVKIGTRKRYTDLPAFLEPTGTGKLVTSRTREKPGFGNLPASSCTYYTQSQLYLSEEHKGIIDESYRVVDTMRNPNFPPVYVISDEVYFERNPDHYNIEVDFLYKDPGNPNADTQGFVEYDWWKENCTTFDGRFPVLSDKTSALEGTLRYGMYSQGFQVKFSIRVLKLRIQVKDRDLNRSNVIETPEFTLESIRGRGC